MPTVLFRIFGASRAAGNESAEAIHPWAGGVRNCCGEPRARPNHGAGGELVQSDSTRAAATAPNRASGLGGKLGVALGDFVAVAEQFGDGRGGL